MAQLKLPVKLRRHPVVLEEQQRRAADLQLRIADWITGFAGAMNFVYLHIAALRRSRLSRNCGEWSADVHERLSLSWAVVTAGLP